MVTLIDNRPLAHNSERPRHPEKIGRPDAAVLPKPPWIRARAPGARETEATRSIVRAHGLRTVCEEAQCPNLGECWQKRHATMMIMGSVCTRACAFCDVATGRPDPLDATEPARVAAAVRELGLDHVVITSVDRDDLADGGATHFADVIGSIRAAAPATTVEVLIPDFLRKEDALETVVAARPDVLNHNLETVPRLYRDIRPGAREEAQRMLVARAKALAPDLFTKSGIMLGLGETTAEVIAVMDDLRGAGVDFITLGQYLAPSRKHAEVKRYATPDEFAELGGVALRKGFLVAASSPLTRSSHHASEDFRRLKAARAAASHAGAT